MREIVFVYSFTMETVQMSLHRTNPAAAMISDNDSPSLWAADVEATRQLSGENVLASIPGSSSVSFTHLEICIILD